jgi:hypothetical protein
VEAEPQVSFMALVVEALREEARLLAAELVELAETE